MEKWADRWATLLTSRQTRLKLPRLSMIVTDYIMSLDIADCSLLVQISYVTGASESKECRLSKAARRMPGIY